MLNISPNRLETGCWLIFTLILHFLDIFQIFVCLFGGKISLFNTFGGLFLIFWGTGVTQLIALIWGIHFFTGDNQPEVLSEVCLFPPHMLCSDSQTHTWGKWCIHLWEDSQATDSQAGAVAPKGSDNRISRSVGNFKKLPMYFSLVLELQSWDQNLSYSNCSHIQQKAVNLESGSCYVTVKTRHYCLK